MWGTPKSNASREVMQLGSRASADGVWVPSRPCLLLEGKFGMCALAQPHLRRPAAWRSPVWRINCRIPILFPKFVSRLLSGLSWSFFHCSIWKVLGPFCLCWSDEMSSFTKFYGTISNYEVIVSTWSCRVLRSLWQCWSLEVEEAAKRYAKSK